MIKHKKTKRMKTLDDIPSVATFSIHPLTNRTILYNHETNRKLTKNYHA